MAHKIGKLVVCGVGLIGGSFALALKQAGVVREVVGLGRSRENLQAALRLGAIDAIAPDWRDALTGANLVLLALQVGQMEAQMQALAPYLEAQTIITDAGSTKGDVVAAAYRQFDARAGQFVPAHPIAGGEASGVTAASADLYRDKRVVITPLKENPQAALELVRDIWGCCGAQVSNMTPAEHDRIFAAVSHLPHVLAFALVHELTQRPNAEELFSFAAGGFRDFTRIAGSHPEMWRDISLANREPLLLELDAYIHALKKIRALIERGDGVALAALFERASSARKGWAQKSN